MKVPPVLLAASLVLVLAGCAQPAPAATDDPVVSAPSETAAEPDAKPTAAPPPGLCFADYGFTDDEVQEGGDVTWFPPLQGDAIGVEPSCWVDYLETERNLFFAGWYGMDNAEYDLVNTPIEAALQADGFQLGEDTNGISTYSKVTGELEELGVTITRTDGYYELLASYGRG